jgi:hypothetical protein
MPVRRLAGLVAASTALVVAGGTPAWSDTYNHRDARHDVAVLATAGADYHRAPENRKFDITHTRVIHSSSRIRVDVTLRSASMRGVQWRNLGFKMKTNTDTYFGGWTQYHGEYQLDLSDDTTGQEVQCDMWTRGHGRTISLVLDRTTCVGNPRWIRVGVSVAGVRGERQLVDVAQSNSWRASDYKLSPRLRPST